MIAWVHAQEMTSNLPPHPGGKSTPTPAQGMPSDDAVAPAQPPQPVLMERPEPLLIAHDPSAVFQAMPAQAVSPALANLPDDGKLVGVDNYRDPLDAPVAEAAGGSV
ncbi:MAG TPA: hypothetical protein VEP67_11540 [Thiobacillaceae bacterium]|nr:hypothetical protein [Thiobacillaceae bacterium]